MKNWLFTNIVCSWWIIKGFNNYDSSKLCGVFNGSSLSTDRGPCKCLAWMAADLTSFAGKVTLTWSWLLLLIHEQSQTFFIYHVLVGKTVWEYSWMNSSDSDTLSNMIIFGLCMFCLLMLIRVVNKTHGWYWHHKW